MENVRDRIKLEFIEKDDNDKVFKQQSKLTLKVKEKLYTNYDSYIVEQNEVLWIS